MIAHQTSGENRPAIEISDLAQNLDELDRLRVIVEDKLAAGNTAADVVRRSGKKKAGMSDGYHVHISTLVGRESPNGGTSSRPTTSCGRVPPIRRLEHAQANERAPADRE